MAFFAALLLAPLAAPSAENSKAAADTNTVRFFVFAGQSNMVGSDSKPKDIRRFPPFAGLEAPQDMVLFSYNIGREDKRTLREWIALRPVKGVVGPELSFAGRVAQETKAPKSAMWFAKLPRPHRSHQVEVCSPSFLRPFALVAANPSYENHPHLCPSS